MIMCDVRASGITGDVADSYLVRVEPRANGGAHVLWTDEPDQAMVFDDADAAAEFCRDSPLEMFVVPFVPVSGPTSTAPAPPPRQVESETDFLKRLSQVRAEAEARAAAAITPAEAEELRDMGLM